MANAQALDFGPLSPAVMAEIEAVLDRPPEGPPREALGAQPHSEEQRLSPL